MQMKDEISNWEAAIFSSSSQTKIHTNFEIYIHTNMKFSWQTEMMWLNFNDLVAFFILKKAWLHFSETFVYVPQCNKLLEKISNFHPPTGVHWSKYLCLEHPGNWTQVKHFKKHRWFFILLLPETFFLKKHW